MKRKFRRAFEPLQVFLKIKARFEFFKHVTRDDKKHKEKEIHTAIKTNR